MAGSVKKRPDGKYRARYRDAAGKEHAKHFDRKLDADRWLATVQVALTRGEWIDPALGRVTLADWSRTWLDGMAHLKPSTRVRYASILTEHVLPRWGTVPLTRITHADASSWVGHLATSGMAASSVRQVYRVFSLLLDLAVRDGRLPRNPAAGIRLPRPAKSEKRFLTHHQVADLAAASAPPNDLLVYVLAYTGLRWGELAGLRVQDLTLDRARLTVNRAVTEVNGRIVIGTPKSHHRREVPLPSFLVPPLRLHTGGRDPEQLVFTSPTGAILRNNNFRRNVFSVAAAKAGLPGLTPHELRHTAASLAIAAGANVKAVQRMLGHASAAMTLDIYAGLFADDLDVVATNLDLGARLASADWLRTNSTESGRGDSS